jgi:predicted enzyme related to lactoylglutathione lyase
MIMIEKINCIEIPVSNMRKSIAFCEEILGLEKSYEHPVWTSFDIQGTSLTLAVSGTKVGNKDAETCKSCTPCVLRYTAGKGQQVRVYSSAFAIYLSVKDLDKRYQELKENGVEFLSKPREQVWGGRTAVMIDPDDNLFVLSEDM